MIVLRLVILIFLSLPLLMNGQGIFESSKVKTKRKKDQEWIKIIKLVSSFEDENIFINNISQDLSVANKWDVFPESAGTITLEKNHQRVFLEGFADLGQEIIDIQLVDSVKPIWKLSTTADTAFLGNMQSQQQQLFSEAELYQFITTNSINLPFNDSDKKAAVRLTTFSRAEQASLNLSIQKVGKIDVYPVEFEIISSLLLTLWMMKEKSIGQD